jgi:hypothetical protein
MFAKRDLERRGAAAAAGLVQPAARSHPYAASSQANFRRISCTRVNKLLVRPIRGKSRAGVQQMGRDFPRGVLVSRRPFAHFAFRPGGVAYFTACNLGLPQSERNRPRYAWSPPKKHYTSSALCHRRQQANPARLPGVTRLGACVEVVCADE